MLVSIIITVYNKENQLSRCIESVINQSYKELDIIIINDGSTDGSENIINKYLGDNRIRYYKQENKGVAYTRNRGIKLSQGDYIFFMDGDDELPHDSICMLIDKISVNTDMVVGNFIYKSKFYTRKNKELKEGKYEEQLGLKSIQLKYDMFISNGRPLASVCNKLYRRRFLVDNQLYFEEGVIAEDRLFNLYCYCKYPNLTIVNKYTYIIHKIEGSRSRSYIKDFYTSITNLTIKFYEFLCKNNILEENNDLLFMNLIYDIEKIHRYILKYSTNKSKDIKKYTTLIKENHLFNLILENGLTQKYLKKIRFNNKKWFLIIYIKLILYIPQLIYPYLYISNLALNAKIKIKSKRH